MREPEKMIEDAFTFLEGIERKVVLSIEDFEKLASEKTVLFITTSPVNSSLNSFISSFYGTVFKDLFECLKKYLKENDLEEIIEIQNFSSLHISVYYFGKVITVRNLEKIKIDLIKLNKKENIFQNRSG